MADIQVQLRRGTTTQHASFTGAEGEVTVDTDLDTLMVHDGSTAGGIRLAKHSELSGAGAGGTVTEVDAGTGLETSPAGGITTTGTIGIADDGVTAAKISSTDNTFKVATTEVVINEGGADVDFRVEGDTNANLIVADAGEDKVAIRGAIDATNEIALYGDVIIKDSENLASLTIEQTGSTSGAIMYLQAPGNASVRFIDTNATTDNQVMQMSFGSGQLLFQSLTDDETAVQNNILSLNSDGKVGIGGAVDPTFPVYIHGDQAAGMGVTGNIQINRLAGAGIRLFTDFASNPNKTTDITTTTTGDIQFNKPDKASNPTTHLFEANGDIETLTGSYGTISDRNLKENINYLTDEQKAGQVADIKNLKFAKYNLKGEGVTQLGVIAQDVEQTSPGLVSKSIINGSEVRSVKQSIIHQKAVVALQVALEKIEDLEQRLKLLES